MTLTDAIRRDLRALPDVTFVPGDPAVVLPATVQALAAVLGHTGDFTVAVVGARTSAAPGEPWTAADIVVDTSRLDALLSYDPGELVVRAQAGMPLARLQRTLAEHGQRLALDPEHDRGTLGGIVAADASGPLRLRHGTVRDQLLGVTVVLADGRVARAGGNVVKNVAGYDLGKLYTGSLGTLGVLAELAFRVAPLPPGHRWLAVPCGLPVATDLARAIDEAALEPAAAQWYGPGEGEGELRLLFEGVPAAVEDVIGQARALVTPFASGAPQSRTAGTRPVSPGAGGMPARLRLAAPPSCLPGLVRHTVARCARSPETVWTEAAVGVGVATLSLPAPSPAGPPSGWGEALDGVRELAAAYGGSVVVDTGPGAARLPADPWGVPPGAVALMRTVKNQFDPRRRLNRHRFLEGL
ncbi:FAD-binding oxidoreductase [Streptosporangium sp. NPDC002544]|uniref:FAD-binding oxidoreductase n=1 Tax=Streptosporangium sp. NPDC002544 TaxID=3154538 RepID=UPI00332F46C7